MHHVSRRTLSCLALTLIGVLLMVPNAAAATFNVTTVADQDNGSCPAGGPCSLRDAITAANASAGADIVLLPAGTITLSTALPNITGPVEIRGAGMTATQVARADGSFNSPILNRHQPTPSNPAGGDRSSHEPDTANPQRPVRRTR